MPVWITLFANVLAFSELPTLLPIPTTVGRLVTQGALVVAFILALWANPRGVIRPNVFLVLLSLLAVVALVVSIHNEFLLGSTFRASRLVGFVAVLWLLTPWWGEVWPSPAALSHHLLTHRGGHSFGWRSTRSRRSILVSRPPASSAVIATSLISEVLCAVLLLEGSSGLSGCLGWLTEFGRISSTVQSNSGRQLSQARQPLAGCGGRSQTSSRPEPEGSVSDVDAAGGDRARPGPR